MGTNKQNQSKQNQKTQVQKPSASSQRTLDTEVEQEELGQLLQRAERLPDSLTLTDVDHLQRTIGNQAMGRIAIDAPAPNKNDATPYPSLQRMLDNRLIDGRTSNIFPKTIQRDKEDTDSVPTGGKQDQIAAEARTFASNVGSVVIEAYNSVPDRGWFFSQNAALDPFVQKPASKEEIKPDSSEERIVANLGGYPYNAAWKRGKDLTGYALWPDTWGGVFWGKTMNTCNVVTGEIIYRATGDPFINSVKHYWGPGQISGGARGRLKSIQPKDVVPGDIVVKGVRHIEPVIEVNAKEQYCIALQTAIGHVGETFKRELVSSEWKFMRVL